MIMKRIGYAAAALAAALILLTACAAGEPHSVREQKQGTIAGHVYLSQDGRFTLNADPGVWQTDEEKNAKEENLYLAKETNVWVSFSETSGLTTDMVKTFESSFVERYMEGIRVGFPDAQTVGSEILSDRMAKIDITMTYGSGLYSMWQILYLVTDGENGYIITVTLPEEKAKILKPTIYKLIESFQFTDITPQIDH